MVKRGRRLKQSSKAELRGKRLTKYMSVAPVTKMTDIAMLSSYNAGLKEATVRDVDEVMKAVRISDEILTKWKRSYKKKYGVNLKPYVFSSSRKSKHAIKLS
jgi:hypothetical protein